MLQHKQNYFRLLQRILFALSIAMPLSGCMMMKLKQNLSDIEQLAQVAGEVTSIQIEPHIVIAVLRVSELSTELVNYKVLSGNYAFEFQIEPGSYQLFAFADRNSDLKYDSDEPAVRSDVLALQVGEKQKKVELVLPREADQELVHAVDEFRRIGKRELPSFKENLGKVVSLQNDAFTDKNSKAGMWEPYRFVKEVPFGVFFLEEYSPKKIPVLFVHGINGNPRNFEEIIGRLDRSRYQPWLVYYPSGFRLPLVVEVLNNCLNELQARHGFREMYLVAHSMGGLVSRGLILKNATRPKGTFITRFITLSTPWGGHAAAASGVEVAPVVMPVWNDMAPESEYLKQIFSSELPTPHYMLFSYNAGAGLLRSEGDGVVSLSSQLRLEAQSGARMVRGFDVSHTGILADPSSISTVLALLGETKS